MKLRSMVALGVVGTFVLGNLVSAQKKFPARPEEKQLIASFQGPELYRAYCATCHGKDAKGNGPTAPSLKVAPPDLTGIAMRNGGTYPFERVQKIISGEEQSPRAHGNREMPVWGPLFSEVSWDQDLGRVRIYVLAKYLEGLQK
jgi:mono/diheme cytochrome c family protein